MVVFRDFQKFGAGVYGECGLNTEVLKHQIWHNLNKLLAMCRGTVYKGSQRILFIRVSFWSFVRGAWEHPKLSVVQPTPTSSHAGAQLPAYIGYWSSHWKFLNSKG